jgi:hypothetical protein
METMMATSERMATILQTHEMTLTKRHQSLCHQCRLVLHRRDRRFKQTWTFSKTQAATSNSTGIMKQVQMM